MKKFKPPLAQDVELYGKLMDMMAALPSPAWRAMKWRIGFSRRTQLKRLRNPAGVAIYSPGDALDCSRLYGSPVEWVEGSVIQLRSEHPGHTWVIR